LRHEPAVGDDGPAAIELTPWFTEALTARFKPDKLARVMAWLDAGGHRSRASVIVIG
jgi:hypothetical protein